MGSAASTGIPLVEKQENGRPEKISAPSREGQKGSAEEDRDTKKDSSETKEFEKWVNEKNLNCKSLEDKYVDAHQTIGHGSTAVVRLYSEIGTGKLVAVKFLRKTRLATSHLGHTQSESPQHHESPHREGILQTLSRSFRVKAPASQKNLFRDTAEEDPTPQIPKNNHSTGAKVAKSHTKKHIRLAISAGDDTTPSHSPQSSSNRESQTTSSTLENGHSPSSAVKRVPITFANTVARLNLLLDSGESREDEKQREAHQALCEFVNREIQIMLQVQGNPNLLELYDVFETPSAVILVTEYARGGELFRRLLATMTFREADARLIIMQLVDALAHLHGMGIVHRDIKPQNILLTKPDDFHIKLADFGLAKIVRSERDKKITRYENEDHERLMTTACGTLMYAAPEIIKHISYDPSVDMWSTGVVLFQLLSGDMPFDKVEDILSVNFGGKFDQPIWERVSPEAQDLVRSLLHPNPTMRLKPEQVKQHPWFSISLGEKQLDEGPSKDDKTRLAAPEMLAALQKHRAALLEQQRSRFVQSQVEALLEVFHALEVPSERNYALHRLVLAKLEELGFVHIPLDPSTSEAAVLVSGRLYYLLDAKINMAAAGTQLIKLPSQEELAKEAPEVRSQWPDVISKDDFVEQVKAHFEKVLSASSTRRQGVSISVEAPPSPRLSSRPSSRPSPRRSSVKSVTSERGGSITADEETRLAVNHARSNLTDPLVALSRQNTREEIRIPLLQVPLVQPK